MNLQLKKKEKTENFSKDRKLQLLFGQLRFYFQGGDFLFSPTLKQKIEKSFWFCFFTDDLTSL